MSIIPALLPPYVSTIILANHEAFLGKLVFRPSSQIIWILIFMIPIVFA